VRPHTVRRPRLPLGDGAATRVDFFGERVCVRIGPRQKTKMQGYEHVCVIRNGQACERMGRADVRRGRACAGKWMSVRQERGVFCVLYNRSLETYFIRRHVCTHLTRLGLVPISQPNPQTPPLPPTYLSSLLERNYPLLVQVYTCKSKVSNGYW